MLANVSRYTVRHIYTITCKPNLEMNLHLQILWYLYIQLPEPTDDWTHNVTVDPDTSRLLSLGETCTFFACFVYCSLDSCKRVYRDFQEEIITIGKCFLLTTKSTYTIM